MYVPSARARAKASSKFKSSTDAATFAKIAEKAGPVEFVGYEIAKEEPSAAEKAKLRALEGARLCGFVCKGGSPSCAMV